MKAFESLRVKVLACAMAWVAVSVIPCLAGSPKNVGVCIGRNIRPFVEMVDGFRESAGSDFTVSHLFLDRDANFPGDLCRWARPYDLLVAVGPRALLRLENLPGSQTFLYGMVLNPDKIVGNRSPVCGVSLNLPQSDQMAKLKAVFPQLRTLGVLYDPANNESWVRRAKAVGKFLSLNVVGLPVRARSDVSTVVRSRLAGIDALLMIPDRTVISKTLIQYVIKQAFLRGIPTIGYNRFFHEAGAAASFIIDYREVGRFLADKARRVLLGKSCTSSGPPYRVWVKKKVVETLRIPLADPLPGFAEVRP